MSEAQAAAPAAPEGGTPAAPEIADPNAAKPAEGAEPKGDALVIEDPAAVAAAKAAAEAAKPAQAYTYTPSGDPGLDLALDFIGGLGFGPDHAAVKAAEGGDFSQLEAELKGLGDKAKGWEKQIAVGKAGFERLDKAGKEKAAATTSAIHEIAGGAQQWAKIQAWAGTEATPDERAAVNAALRSGGIVAKAVARELVSRYMRHPGATKTGEQVRKPESATTGTTSTALSPKDYGAEVHKLAAKLGNRMETSPEYRQLRARRAAWRG